MPERSFPVGRERLPKRSAALEAAGVRVAQSPSQVPELAQGSDRRRLIGKEGFGTQDPGRHVCRGPALSAWFIREVLRRSRPTETRVATS